MMFRHFSNIDSAFRYVRLFTMVIIVSYTLLMGFMIFRTFRLEALMQQRLYVLYNGKVLEAVAADRRDNIRVEAWDHVLSFHLFFFGLEPDEKLIREQLGKAFYLADGSAWRIYENLKEAGYYANIVSGNISQQVRVDSIRLDMDHYPYAFRCFATERIIRASSITTRSLVTAGWLRNMARSTSNSHGLLIERLEIVENKDVQVQNR